MFSLSISFMTMCRLYIDLQFAIGDEVVEKHAMVKKWDDWATDIWDTFGYDRQDSLKVA